MLHLETPHVNVLSKVDLMDKYGDLDFNLEYYADVQDLSYLADRVEEEGRRRGVHVRRHAWDGATAQEVRQADAESLQLVEDFGLVNLRR